jgi:hypothetical protein
MRRDAKIDANQLSIVRTLRQTGASVQSLAAAGGGVPDLLVGVRGKNFLLEVKDGSNPPSKRKLTPDQIIWHRDWLGQVVVVNNEDEALEAIGIGATK